MVVNELERKPVSKYVQLKAMLCRNILLKKRLGIKTIAECLFPFCVLIILIVIKIFLTKRNYPSIPHESAETPIGLGATPNPLTGNSPTVIYIIPNTNETRNFTKEMQNFCNRPSSEFEFLNTEAELEVRYALSNLSKPLQLAVVFHGNPYLNMSYTIRNHPDLLPAPSQLYASGDACRSPNAIYPQYNYLGSCPINSYFYSKFLAIQSIVEGTWLKLTVPKADIPPYLKEYTIQLFPKGPFFAKNENLNTLRKFTPYFMMLTLLISFSSLLTLIVGEKEKKIKEGLRMVGLSDSVYWASWFLIYLFFVTCLTLVSTGILYASGLFRNSNPGLVYLLFLLYGVSVLMLAFLISPFFDKAKYAGFFGFVIYICQNFIETIPNYGTSTWVGWILGLFPQTGFVLGMKKVLFLELTTAQGVTAETRWVESSLPLAGCYIMLSVDIVLYGLLAYYLDNVLPSKYGSRKSPWFCLVPAFWSRPKRNNFIAKLNHADESVPQEQEDIEPVPKTMEGKEVLRIRELSKTFRPFRKPKVKAVCGLSFDAYEGQITGILGHNGAGKTTLFHMLTGMTSPTKGSAYLYGYDLSDSNQLGEIRRMAGVCLQEDVLFDLLTPREHLEFYAKIRGVNEEAIDEEVEKTLKDIDLAEKADTLAINLSGGQKRKLSIGIAFIGDPKIVFLDEPTAGVDPYSRRHLWNFLQQRKRNKVILLTTHFMDEADLLADRKAILSQGKIRCLGSSLFLKNKFGLGYYLTFVLDENLRDIEKIRELVEHYVSEGKLNRHYGRELSFILPRHQISAFPHLFYHLERLVKSGEASEIGFTTYGISMSTLEEVFLKLGEEAEQAKILSGELLFNSSLDSEDRKLSDGSQTDAKAITENVKNATWECMKNLEVPIRESHNGQTLRALLKVRGINILRDPKILVILVLPVALAAYGLWVGSLPSNSTVIETKGLLLSLDKYRPQLDFQPFLYYEDSKTNMSTFWKNFAEKNRLKFIWYTGDFSEILEFSNHNSPSSFAVDTKKKFSLVSRNLTVGNNTTIAEIPIEHTRLRFNDSMIHLPPMILNAISNSLLLTNNATKKITLSVLPLPHINASGSLDIVPSVSVIFIGLLFVWSLAALTAEIVLDREIHVKNLLRVNGLTLGLYFGSFFIVLGSMMITTCILLILLMVAFQLQAFIIPAAICLLAIFSILFFPAANLFATCASYLFDTAKSAQLISLIVSSLVGIVPYIIVMLCDTFKVGGSTALATGLHIGVCFIDVLYTPFGFLFYVYRTYSKCLLTPALDRVDICQNLSFGDYMSPEIISIFVALLFHIPFFYILLTLIDVKHSGGQLADAFRCFRKKEGSHLQMDDDVPDVYSGLGDSDVKEEYSRVRRLIETPASLRDEAPVAIVQDLHKEYQNTERNSSIAVCSKGSGKARAETAVKTLSFTVQPGEVFGLLGHNGAGKTTTMKIVTAEEAPSHGRVQVAGHDIMSNQSKAFQAMGYCPQHDALWPKITVREHLEAYAAIRGIEFSHIKKVIELFLCGLQIEEHANKYTKDCSGGTKRKLSYALAILGSPSIVLLDEPSTGMDPQSKRFLWNTISASVTGKRGAILTTHSMEEADALCSRLGIMVKGELRCLGTSQHLKNRYGSGYLLEIKMKGSRLESNLETSRQERNEALMSFIHYAFPNASVKESFEDRVIFNISQESIGSLAEAFAALETAREDLSIEEYSLSQTTLEQVFINFAQLQQEDKD